MRAFDHVFFSVQVIVADNFFTGSKDNLKKWIGHPRFELIRHGIATFSVHLVHELLLHTSNKVLLLASFFVQNLRNTIDLG